MCAYKHRCRLKAAYLTIKKPTVWTCLKLGDITVGASQVPWLTLTFSKTYQYKLLAPVVITRFILLIHCLWAQETACLEISIQVQLCLQLFPSYNRTKKENTINK